MGVLLAGLLLSGEGLAAGRKAPAARRAKTAAGSSAAARKGGPKPDASARRLEDIHIEGEIPVPQILFITARDQRRFMEFQHRRYLRNAQRVGEDAALPTRIVVTGDRPAPDKENPR